MDEIWGKRFIQRGNQPAWHHKGLLIGEQEMSAEMALDMLGEYFVELMPMITRIEYRGKVYERESNFRQITRMPTQDDPAFREFGAPVHKSYELIGPRQAAKIWDRAVADADGKPAPVETFGILREGQELFISTKIASINIYGDEVDVYLVFDSPMYSNNAAIVVVTAVRPVCANTLSLGIKQATSKIIVPHTPGAADKLEDWLGTMYMDTAGIVRTAQSDFELMANRHIKSLESTRLLEEVYPDPPAPQENWHNQFGLTLAQHEERYEEKNSKVKKVRETIIGLFGGDGIAMDTLAVKDTVFGLYNSVAEYEDNRKGTAEGRALGVTVGERAAVVRRAYTVMSEFAKN